VLQEFNNRKKTIARLEQQEKEKSGRLSEHHREIDQVIILGIFEQANDRCALPCR